jgi:hypothetical protein
MGVVKIERRPIRHSKGRLATLKLKPPGRSKLSCAFRKLVVAGNPCCLEWRDGYPAGVIQHLVVLLLASAVLTPSMALAKRAAAPKVDPVVYEDVRYTAPNNETRRAYVQAWDAKTGKMLWEVTVFRIVIKPTLEEDVQWVFIKKLSVEDGKLIVRDERDRSYSVDLKTRTVRKLKRAVPP